MPSPSDRQIADPKFPLLVSFSGIDGSGKTSHARRVAERLRELGVTAAFSVPRYRNLDAVREHHRRVHGSPYAYDTRMDGGLYLGALVADWLAFVDGLHAEPPAGSPVLCLDRYVPDVLAQAVRHGADVDAVARTVVDLPPALCSFYLDIEVADALTRLDLRAEKPRTVLDSEDGLARLLRGYRTTRHHWPAETLDATRPLEETVEAVAQRVLGLLSAEGRAVAPLAVGVGGGS
jgi:thymidylate kinase